MQDTPGVTNTPNVPNLPDPSTFVSSPLRNRISLKLNAPASEVWALVGNLARFPEYSGGLDTVEAVVDPSGKCTEYVCYFKAEEPGGEGIAHREMMRWYEPSRGWASVAEADNAFGLTDAITLVALEPRNGGTVVRWSQFYDAGDLNMNKAVFDTALADIGDNLVRRFGGEVLERYVQE